MGVNDKEIHGPLGENLVGGLFTRTLNCEVSKPAAPAPLVPGYMKSANQRGNIFAALIICCNTNRQLMMRNDEG